MYPSNSNFTSILSCFDQYWVPYKETHHSFSSLFDFPNSPNMQYDYEAIGSHFHDLFHEHNSLTTDETAVLTEVTATNYYNINMADSTNIVAGDLREEIPKKRSSKKDRHSKINTAKGPRDRRMRLSLEVARKFFGLQDMLGFDKASKTVDWLLKNSRSAIKELVQGPCSINHKQSCSVSSTTSECEVVSSAATCENESVSHQNKKKKKTTTKKMIKRSKIARPTVAKESRKKARERARARTSEKRSLRESEPKRADDNHLNPSYQHPSNAVEDTIFNYQHISVNSCNEHQYTDFLFGAEAYSSL